MKEYLRVYITLPDYRMVVGNDFRKLFPEVNTDGLELMGEHWRRNMACITMAYADAGLLHAYVGNTCPGLFLEKRGVYNLSPCNLPNYVASITTDLWWYSICSYNEYVKRGGIIDQHVDVVEIIPGDYELTHYNFDGSDYKGDLYATLRRIDPEEPA